MHLYSLCQTWLNLKTHTVSETENRKQNIMSDYIRQTVTVSSCQSDISNQCRIKTPCITGMAEKSNPPLAGWRITGITGGGVHPPTHPLLGSSKWGEIVWVHKPCLLRVPM